MRRGCPCRVRSGLWHMDRPRLRGQRLDLRREDPQYAAPPLLQRMVEAGLLGRKSGRGFHDYAPVLAP
ncbi:3-hydroxyacyl-CoA dehydrogenase family protein [Streptomyces sp. NPDC005648]|uniref:3-hydroxyacyl-CoA dehydrogenase family protein n=1 Tax=Streptomyces sp. NPDC005648 TaxID=3157044 RepID=UPI0033AF64D8